MEQSERKAKEREKQRKKQERAARREMRRYRRAFAFFRFVLKPFLRRKFGYRCDDLSKIEGPYLLLANHNTEFDPMLVGLATKKQLFFVASEHIMRKGFGTWFLTRYFRPIIHRKGKDGAKSVFSILKTLRSGSSVALFAEGNRSFDGVTGPIAEATGKMAKAAGVPVVTFRLEGGFLTQPRFSTNVRKGRMYGRLVHVYSREELAAMSEEDVNKAIAADLHEDAYEAQKRERIAYKGKKKKHAYGLESTLCRCIRCGEFGTLRSDRDTLRCDRCGMTAVYDVFGNLTVTDGLPEMNIQLKTTDTDDSDSQNTEIPEIDSAGQTVRPPKADKESRNAGVPEDDSSAGAEPLVTNLRDWVTEQRKALVARIRAAAQDEVLFSDAVTVREIDENHKFAGEREATLLAYRDHVCIAGGEHTEVLRDLAVYSRNFITAYCESRGPEGGARWRQYDIRGNERFNALKYYDLMRESEAPANDTH